MRIGVVTDTHVGDHLPALPPEVLERFDGVDLIIHGGDVNDPRVLDELREVAPVAACAATTTAGPSAACRSAWWCPPGPSASA